MNNVENRVVEMKFDNSQFEQAVAKTMTTLDKFKEKLNFEDAGKGFDKLGSVTSKYSGILGDIGSAIDSVSDHFSNLSGVGERVFSVLTNAATGFLTSGINKLTADVVQGGQSRAMNLEQAKFQLQGILGNAEEVNRVIYDDILPELQGTPFSLDQAAVVMGQLAASGKKSSEEVRQGTRAIAGAAAMTNSSFADMGRIFTKVAGNGRVMGDTLQEMSSRGLNAAADMGKVFNMTEAEVREAVTAGEVSYDMFATAMDQLYGEQATKSTTMYTGALEDLRAALARIGAEPQAVKLEFLRDAFNALVPAVDAVNAVLKPLWNSSHALVTELDADGNEITKYAKEFQGPVAQSVQKAGWAFQSLFVHLNDNHDIMRYTADDLEQMGFQFEEAEDGTRSYFEVLEDGSKAYHDVGEAIMNHDMLRILTSSAHSAVNIFTALTKVMKAVGQGILDAFPKIGLKNIADVVDGVENFTKALILSDDTLQNIKYVVQAVFTPIGLLVRATGVAIKVFVEFGRIVYKAVAPVMKTLFSMAGGAAGIFAGLGKAVDHAAADITGMAMKLYEAAKSFAQFLHLDKLVGRLKAGLDTLSSTFTKVGVNSYEFLSNLSENAKKAGKAIYSKLRLDDFGKKLVEIKDRLKSAFMATGYAGFEKIVDAFLHLRDAIKNLFSTSLSLGKVGGTIKDFGTKIARMIPTDKILSALDTFADLLVTVIYSIAGFVGPKIETVVDFFSRLGRQIIFLFKALKSFASTFGIINTLKVGLYALSKIIPRLFGFRSFGDILEAVKVKIKGFADAFKELIDAITGGAIGGAKNFGANMKNGLNGLVDDKMTNKVQKFSGVMKAFGSIVSGIAGGIGEKLKEFYKALEEGDKKKIIASLSLLLMAFGYLRTITKVGKTVKTAGKVFKVFKHAGEGIVNIGKAFTGVGKAIKRITYLIGITTSLLIFAAALSLLGRMDMDTLVQGGIAAIGSLIALAISLALLDKVAGKTPEGAGKIMKLAGAMAAVGAAVYLIAKSMEKMAIIFKALGPTGYAVVVATLAGMLVAFGILAKQFSRMDKMEVSLKSAGLAMLAIATSIKLMVGAMKAIGEMDLGSLLKGGITITALLGLMTALSYFAGRNDNVAKAGTALAKMSASLLLLWVALKLYASMDLGTFIHGLLFMAGTLAALLGVMTLFKTVSGPKEAGGIIAIAFAVGILAGALLLLSQIPILGLVKSLGMLVVAFIAIAAIMALFSGIGIGMLAVAGAFALLGIAMLSMGAGALALALALSMLVPLMMALSAVPIDIVKEGLKVLGTIAEGLKEMFYDLAKGVLAFGVALLVAAVAAVVLGAGIVLIGAGLLVASLGLLAFAGAIATLAMTIQAIFGGDFLAGIGQGIQNFGSVITTGLSGIVEQVKGIFSHDKGKEAADDYVAGAQESVNENSGGLSESFTGVFDEMLGSAGNKKEEFKTTMSDLMGSGSEGIVAGGPDLTNSFGLSLDELKNMAGSESPEIADMLGTIPDDAGGAIKQNTSKYTGALSSMFKSGEKVSKKNRDTTKKDAKANAKAYSDAAGSNEAKQNAEKATKNVVDASKKAFKNIKKSFKTEGINAGEGFRLGIRSKADDAAREAADMVRKAIRAAKKAEDSNSPSKEFAKLGVWGGEGYVIGLKSMGHKVETAASDMVAGGLNAVTEAMAFMSAASMLDDFNPTITPVVDLSNVDQSISQIGSMFGSSFGFTTPFASTNAAIIARSMADFNNQNEQINSLNEMVDKLGTMVETMSQNRGQSINPEEIYNAVRQGASQAEIKGITLNGRELKRGLRDMGVITR